MVISPNAILEEIVTMKSDMFAFGIALHAMLVDTLPFVPITASGEVNAVNRRSDSKDRWDISVHREIADEFIGFLSEKELSQSWSALALLDALTMHAQLLSCAEQHHRTMHHGFSRFDLNEDNDGVWFEGTAQMAVAYILAGQFILAENLRNELDLTQQTSPYLCEKPQWDALQLLFCQGFHKHQGCDNVVRQFGKFEVLFCQNFHKDSYLEDWKFELLARQVENFLSMVFPTVLFWAMIYNDRSSDNKYDSYECTCSDSWWCFDLSAFLYATLMILMLVTRIYVPKQELQDKGPSQFDPLVFSKQVMNRKGYFNKHQYIFLIVGIEVGNRGQLMGIWKGSLCTVISSNSSAPVKH
jgi:hypothetical protein